MPEFKTELARAQAMVREAGQRALREISQGLSVDRKGIDDVVTNIDISVERFLRQELSVSFPEDQLVGEELGGDENARRQWLIDPVDGTLNLTRGAPLSSLSLALQIDQESVVGVIYDPYRDELFSARKSHGAELNGRPIKVASTASFGEAVVAIKATPHTLAEFQGVVTAARDVRRLGTAALELAYVAAGRFDAFIEYGLKAWDTAAGYLLVQEAGGKVSDRQGNPFTTSAPCAVATNGAVHEAFLSALG